MPLFNFLVINLYAPVPLFMPPLIRNLGFTPAFEGGNHGENSIINRAHDRVVLGWLTF